MKKIINKKSGRVIYEGNIDELKEQFENLVEVHPHFKQMKTNYNSITELMKTKLQTMNECLGYDGKILYLPNGSPTEAKNWIINYYSELADKIFIEKNPKNSLEIIMKK